MVATEVAVVVWYRQVMVVVMVGSSDAGGVFLFFFLFNFSWCIVLVFHAIFFYLGLEAFVMGWLDIVGNFTCLRRLRLC